MGVQGLSAQINMFLHMSMSTFTPGPTVQVVVNCNCACVNCVLCGCCSNTAVDSLTYLLGCRTIITAVDYDNVPQGVYGNSKGLLRVYCTS